MEKQLKATLRRTLNTVRRDPKKIVTALRVIEREEKVDQECNLRHKSTGFIPPDRPKNWKSKCMDGMDVFKIFLNCYFILLNFSPLCSIKSISGLDVFKRNVMERIEGNQLEDREQDKMWLVRHLELIRKFTLEDLRIVKTLCVPVFPPHYNILEYYIGLYHDAITTRLKV